MANGPFSLKKASALYDAHYTHLTFGAGAAGDAKWFWLDCKRMECKYRVAVAFTPFAIRWGFHASVEVLRKSARCTACGGKGAETTLPSWGDILSWAGRHSQRIAPWARRASLRSKSDGEVIFTKYALPTKLLGKTLGKDMSGQKFTVVKQIFN